MPSRTAFFHESADDLQRRAVTAASRSLGPEAGRPQLRSEKRLLLIEDSAPLRERLTALLTVPGKMRVAAWAETEADAVAHVREDDFDVLVVDVELRQGSGINVIREVRRLCDGRRQPLIIVLTNYSLPTVRERCLAAGADHFLDKMQQFNEPLALIENLATSRPH
jgi:CheY-like chemotaxis protein